MTARRDIGRAPVTDATAYPVARRSAAASTFHGVRVEDPYDWLCDVASGETRRWLDAQAALTRTVLGRLTMRDRVSRSLELVPADPPQRLPLVRGRFEFRFGRSANGGATLRRRLASDRESTLVFDPADHRTLATLRMQPQFVEPSPSGRFAAFGLAEPGSDWMRLCMVDLDGNVVSAVDRPWTAHLAIEWAADESCCYYSITRARFAESTVRDGVYRHVPGEAADRDELVFDHSVGDGHVALPVLLAGSAKLLVKTLDFITQRAALHVRLAGQSNWHCLLPYEAACNVIGEIDDEVFIETQWQAPRGRVLAFDLACSQPTPREVVPERAAVIDLAHHVARSPLTTVCGATLFVTYLEDAVHRVRGFDRHGAETTQLPLDGPYGVLDMSSDAEGVSIALTDHATPFSRYRLERRRSWSRSLVERVPVSDALDRAEITHSSCLSADGTRVPYSVIRPRHTREPLPTLVYGYGGWGMSLTPQFRADAAAWLALGGAYACANTRGGGEYGSEWHAAGARANRPRTIEDFCAVADELVATGICTSSSLVARGLSNGSLLVAAALNRRPDLFAAAVLEVPLVDVLHLLELPAGEAIAGELGNPVRDREVFESMLRYSPLQNVKPRSRRAAVLVVPAEHDERATPGQAYKYVAALQASALDGQLALLSLVENEGHVGWPWEVQKAVLIEELAFLWTIATSVTGHLAADRSATVPHAQ